MPGPPPKHPSQRRRTNATVALTQLPSEGRRGELPGWPLSRQSKREGELWARLWKTPQSWAWERLGWVDIVARYARLLTEAEVRGARVMILAEVRQLEDRLGLTPMSMLRLRWEVAADDGDEQPELQVMVDIRERLSAVE